MRPRHYAGDWDSLTSHQLAHGGDYLLFSDYSTHYIAFIDNDHATDVLLQHEFGGIVNRRLLSDGHGWNLDNVRHAHADVGVLLQKVAEGAATSMQSPFSG